jgi:hypothetical protein
MITAEEVKEYFDKIKDNPEEVNKFLMSIGVKEKETSYPRVPTVLTIDYMNNNETFETESANEFIDKIVYLCKKHKLHFYYRTSFNDDGVSSTNEESSIRNTVKSYLNTFFSSVHTALNIRGGLCKDNLIQYEVYGSNEYMDNYDRLNTAIRCRTPYIEGLSESFVNNFSAKLLLSGYDRDEFSKFIDACQFSEEEFAFVDWLSYIYEAPCCYPHEAKAMAVLD